MEALRTLHWHDEPRIVEASLVEPGRRQRQSQGENDMGGKVVDFPRRREGATASTPRPALQRLVRTRPLLKSRAVGSCLRLLTSTSVVYGAGEHLRELERFRYGICIRERGQSVPQADHVNETLPDPDDGTAWHLLASDRSGVLVGCARLHMTPDVPLHAISNLRLEAFLGIHDRPFGYVSTLMVSRIALGGGVSVALIQAMMRIGLSAPFLGELAFIHCRPRLATLYERLGLRRFGEPFEDPCAGWQQPMFLLEGDVEHFVHCQSPLLAAAKLRPVLARRKDELLRMLQSTSASSPGPR